MKRVQLFEFEDFTWFPSWIRSSMTRLIAVLHRMLGTKEVVGNLLLEIRKKHHFDNITDMGSGAGGLMPDALEQLNSQINGAPVQLMLTDLYPNQEAIKQFNSDNTPNITYSEQSFDATNLSNTGEGLKTMMNSFHHMPPPIAKKILKSAKDNRQPLLIYEMSENNIPLLVWAIFLPLGLAVLILMSLFMTPFARPLTIRQVIFTYLIPIIPIFYAWDGQASLPRMYAYKDFDELLDGLKDDTYTWEIEPVLNTKGKKAGYYVLGLPK